MENNCCLRPYMFCDAESSSCANIFADVGVERLKKAGLLRVIAGVIVSVRPCQMIKVWSTDITNTVHKHIYVLASYKTFSQKATWQKQCWILKSSRRSQVVELMFKSIGSFVVNFVLKRRYAILIVGNGGLGAELPIVLHHISHLMMLF